MKLNDANSNLTIHIILLTSLVFVMQLTLVTVNIFTYLAPDNFKNNELAHDLFATKATWWPLLQFIFYQCLLYILLSTAVVMIAKLIGEIYKCRKITIYYFGIFFWLVTVTIIILTNSLLFPHSVFAIGNYIFNHYNGYHQLIYYLLPLVIFLIGILALVCWHSIKKIYQHNFSFSHLVVVSALIFTGICTISKSIPRAQSQWQAATNTKPNIIIIGIDGLRPDFVNEKSTPYINKLLMSSINFTQAYSPIAQTFPAWIAILTGTGPKINGARENLPPLDNLNSSDTLASRLQSIGYETIFSTDDPRFITINKEMGFHRLVTPKTGVAEMIIGAFNDFPVSNLFVTTAIGKHIFPFNYANHETSVTYIPENFLQMIDNTLNQPTAKPLFLAVHFNMSGWPFGWARSQHNYEGAWYDRYNEAIQDVDHQFAEFMAILNRHNLLKNSIVVILSDHGVTLGLPHDRAIAELNYQGDPKNISKLDKAEYLPELNLTIKTSLDTSYGYGGDLLSVKQNHIILAIKAFDAALPSNQNVTRQSSLLDIAPTLLAWLKVPPLPTSPGSSLFLPMNKNALSALYLETSTISSVGVPIEKVQQLLGQLAQSYSYDHKRNQVSLQPIAEKKELPKKQYGILSGRWLLVAMPGQERMHLVNSPSDKTKHVLTHFRLPTSMVLLDMTTGKWTTELDSTWAHTTPINKLCSLLITYYGDDMNCPHCCASYL